MNVRHRLDLQRGPTSGQAMIMATTVPVTASVESPEATRTSNYGAAESDEAPRGAHVMKGDLVVPEEPRGAHLKNGDPFLSVERRAVHAVNSQVPGDKPLGAHVMKGDLFLVVEGRALHASKGEALTEERWAAIAAPVVRVAPEPAISPEAAPVVSVAPERVATAGEVAAPDDAPAVGTKTPSTKRRSTRAGQRKVRTAKRQGAHVTASRRWPLVPVAGAAGALAVGLAGGGAYAYITTTGSGTGHAATGSPVAIAITATAGPADLLPGGTGAAYFTLHNTNPFGATFNQVASGAVVVSNNTGLCANSYVSVAHTLPYTFSPAVSVGPNTTSGTQSIASLVKLAANAPSSCQGVTFKVTFTLTGRST